MPAHGRALAKDGGAWKAKQADESDPSHFDAPPSEYVPSRLAIMRSGSRSSSRTWANSARPPSGARPYIDPGVVSPTQPTSMMVFADALGDGEGLVVDTTGAVASADLLGPAAMETPSSSPPPGHAQVQAAATATESVTTTASTAKMRLRRCVPAER